MKALAILVTILLAAAVVLYATVPGNEKCRQQAIEAINADKVGKVPGYQSQSVRSNVPERANPADIIIINRYFYKEIQYLQLGHTSTVGYAYLGKFHETPPGK